jgi:hypothetical protein
MLSKHSKAVKFAGLFLPALLIIPFIIYTQNKTKAITGTREFSVFGGWQLANNAMYMYDHIEVDNKKIPDDTKELDLLVKKYFKTVKPTDQDFAELPGTYFIKVPSAPLKEYMYSHYTFDDPVSQFRAWGRVSPIYNKYGSYLIKKYPISFAKYYLWLNVKNYFLPHLEKFGSYNVGEDSVSFQAYYWFHYKTPAVNSISKIFQGKLFISYLPVFSLLNIYFACYFSCLLFSGRLKRLDSYFMKSLILIAFYLAINFSFSIFATPIVLRYQVIPLTLLFTFSLLLLESSGSTKINTKNKF